MSYDKFACIGGEGWYWERCSANFIVNVNKNMFSETPPVAAPFRPDYPITLGDIQGLQIMDTKRKEYYENACNFALRSGSGTLHTRNDFKFETANFQELSYLIHVSSSFEELFIRRNAVLMFIHRILRSAQVNGASLKPAYPDSGTFCICGKLPHCEFCPMHDLSDEEKEFLFPPLQVGDIVKRGPDWQWGNQGDNKFGTVIQLKDWKGAPEKGVKIHWDNGEENMYRYGVENSYDVINADPMKRMDYQPLSGLREAAETFWSRYVQHYIKGGLAKAKGLFAPHVSKEELIAMLPDYDIEGRRDPEVEQKALHTINEVIEVAERDILVYLSHEKALDSCFMPSPRSKAAISTILFPYQIYAFSQAEGDLLGQRSETAILQLYLSSLFSSCIRIITKATTFIYETGRVPDVMTALRDTEIGQLLPYALSALYTGDYSIDIVSYISGDLHEIVFMWCKLLKLCSIENDINQRKDNLIFFPVFDMTYKAVPQPLVWYLSLFNLLTSLSTKIHYNTRYFQIADKTEEIRRIADSYLLSGGLRKDDDHQDMWLILEIYNNVENKYDVLHKALDERFPEPAWKRKRFPVMVDLELKILAVFAYFKDCEKDVEEVFGSLMKNGGKPLEHVSPQLEEVWRDVMNLREYLRGKKQEFASHQNISVNKAQSLNTLPFAKKGSVDISRGETERMQKMKEYSLRIRSSVVLEAHSGNSTIVNKSMRRLMTFTGEDELKNQEDLAEYTEAETTNAAENYDDFISLFVNKLDLLVNLNKPLDVNNADLLYTYENEWKETLSETEFDAEMEKLQTVYKKTSGMGDEKSTIPGSRKELISISLKKLLLLYLPVTMNDMRRCLDARTENARILSNVFDDAVLYIKTIEDFPQACRLFILGLCNSLTQQRRAKRSEFGNDSNEELYHRDYLHHTDGCRYDVFLLLVSSFKRFMLCLKELFQRSLRNMEWRLGCSILWFFSTLSSPRLPYLASSLELPLLYRTSITMLCRWYGRMSEQSQYVCISPGPMWDSLSQKVIPLASSHFHTMLEEFQNKGCYLPVNTTQIQGIFPTSFTMLANALRLAYYLFLIQHFADYRVKSRNNPAQIKDSLFFWNVQDVTNLYIRQTKPYLSCVQGAFHQFVEYIREQQEAFHTLCESWQPFTHVQYSQVNTSTNPHTCVRTPREKMNIRGSLEADMKISAAEAVVSSGLGLMLFLVKTRYAPLLSLALYGNCVWKMMYFSPRIQKLSLMLLAPILTRTRFIPEVYDTPKTDSAPASVCEESSLKASSTSPTLPTLKTLSNPGNSLLNPPDLSTEESARRACVYFLLHLSSHTDACVGSLVGERISCSLCCRFVLVIYNMMTSPLPLEQKMSLLFDMVEKEEHLFVSTCRMCIHPDGHAASYCGEVVGEEAVYLLRQMMQSPVWKDCIYTTFEQILTYARRMVEIENEPGYWSVSDAPPSPSPRYCSTPISHISSEYDRKLHLRTVWYCMALGIMKVLGSITPRVYSGCRIRIQDIQLEGSNDIDTLIRSAFESKGSGYVIKYDRTMGEALVLLDKIEAPRYVSIYAFDVVDRIPPPRDYQEYFSGYMRLIQEIGLLLTPESALYALPTISMPFFNTKPLALSVHSLQHSILSMFVVRTIHHLVISNPALTLQVSSAVIASLLKVAVRPMPCNMCFSTLIIRQYYNWFIEYLVNTYPGSPRFLPMELQSETYESEAERKRRGSLQFGVGKEDVMVGLNFDGSPRVLRDQNRMKKAKMIAGITGYNEDVCYKVYRAFQDNMESSVSYLMDSKKEFIVKLSDETHDIQPIGMENRDDCVLTDLETGIHRPFVTSSSPFKKITAALLSTVLPPFSRLQKITTINTEDLGSTSLYGVIASVCEEDLIYSPVNPTGVVTSISKGMVQLSTLNVESGMVEDSYYAESQVAVQKYRLLFHLDDITHLRGITGRICTVLSIKYIRELIICLLYMIQNQEDAIERWTINPYDIVRLTKFTYLSYMSSTVLTPASHSSLTLSSSLFYILKQAIMQAIQSSSHGLTLIQAFMDGTWDTTDRNQVTLNVPIEEVLSFGKHQNSVSSISLSKYHKDSIYIASLHPSFPKSKYSDKVTIPGAAGLKVVFDPRCFLDPEKASLTFFQDDKMTEVIARFSGSYESFCSFTIRGNTLRFMYESELKQSDQWGYGFLVQPFENVNWICDNDVLTNVCFDWNCFAFDYIINMSSVHDFAGDDFFNRTMANMIDYLRTSGMPFKSRVVELLLRLLGSPNIHVTVHPDVSGMYHSVLKYCSGIDNNTIVPSQLPNLLEFLSSYVKRDAIEALRIPMTESSLLPPWEAVVEEEEEGLSYSYTCVQLLSRCLYYHSALPLVYVKEIIERIGEVWTEENYVNCEKGMLRFTQKEDAQLIQAFAQHCDANKAALIDGDIASFSLSKDDIARSYSLSTIGKKELQWRLSLIQYFNKELQKVIHLIDLLNDVKNMGRKSLGVIITCLSSYVYPSVKENVLEISIQQTAYFGEGSYPSVEIDNRRVFTEMENMDDEENEEDHNALTSQCTFAQMYYQMKKYPVDVLRCKLDSKDRVIAVKYKGEQGVDWGGLYRDTIERCIEDLFSNRIDLFIPCPNSTQENGSEEERFIPNPRYRESSEALAMYTFIGNLIGLSLRTKHLLPFELSSQVWKAIVGDNLNEEDIGSVDSAFYDMLMQIKEYPEEEKDEFAYVFGLTFSITDSAGNEIELIPSGAQIPVTYENRMRFYKLAMESRFNEGKQACEAIADGVYALIPQRALSLFTWEQLERAVKGAPEISIDVLKKHCVYIGWTENHEVVQRFWRVMSELSNKDRSLFLRFAWGRSKLPKTEKWSRPFKLTYKNAGDDMLPVAHTCFFQLELPQYSSDQIMRERLLIAFHFCAGEFMLRYMCLFDGNLQPVTFSS